VNAFDKRGISKRDIEQYRETEKDTHDQVFKLAKRLDTLRDGKSRAGQLH